MDFEKQEIHVRLTKNSCPIEVGDYETIGEFLHDLRSISPIEIEGLQIEQDYDSVYIYYQRLETDEEYQKRIKPYQAKLKAKEEAEYKKYLELKGKYEGKV